MPAKSRAMPSLPLFLVVLRVINERSSRVITSPVPELEVTNLAQQPAHGLAAPDFQRETQKHVKPLVQRCVIRAVSGLRSTTEWWPPPRKARDAVMRDSWSWAHDLRV